MSSLFGISSSCVRRAWWGAPFGVEHSLSLKRVFSSHRARGTAQCPSLPPPIINMRRFADPLRALLLAKRFIDRWALIGKELRAALGNVQTVFQTNSELAVDDNRRFVAKAHAGLDRR